MRRYSLGVFLDVLTSDVSQWEKEQSFIESLPDVEHLQLLLEYIPVTHKELAFFSKLSRRYPLLVHAPSLDLTLLSPHRAITAASLTILRKAYEFGQKIGVRTFTIHAGLSPKFWTEKKVIESLTHSIRQIQTTTTLPVSVENMSENWSIQFPYPSTVAHVVNVAKRNAVTIDTGHFLRNGTNPLPVIQNFSKKIVDIHLHDGMPGKAHLPLGEGILDLQALFGILEKTRYNRYVTIEVVGKDGIRASWEKVRKLLK